MKMCTFLQHCLYRIREWCGCDRVTWRSLGLKTPASQMYVDKLLEENNAAAKSLLVVSCKTQSKQSNVYPWLDPNLRHFILG